MSGVIDPLCEVPTEFGCMDNSKTCSPLFSKSLIGNYCRDEYSKLNASGRDTVMQDYCIRHPDSDECKCVSRSSEPNYVRLKVGNPYSDACWYTPCTNRFQYFIPSEFEREIQCPQNVCQLVYNISDTRDVDVSKIKNDINCDFSTQGGIPTITTTPSWIYISAIVIFALYILVYLFKKG